MDLSTRAAEYDPSSTADAAADERSEPFFGARIEPAAWNDVGTLVVERVTSANLAGYEIAWADLAKRALEQNVFLEPGFALPLLQHASGHDRPDMLLVWEPDGPTSFGRLVGLLPIARPCGLTWPMIVRGFAHVQSGRGTPLLDRDRADEVFAAMLTWLRDREPRAGALLLAAIPSDGLVCAVAIRHGVRVRRVREHRRAVLSRNAAGGVSSHISGKRRKEMRRQRRRLSELGARRYRSARTPSEVALATERFLALEDKGWKGQRGSAMLATPSLATFIRTMTRLMAREGKCRIDSIEIDGRTVAMGIVLEVDAEAFFWKTAFDEAYSAWSPGVQFALDLTTAQLDDPAIAVTDSCAIPDHPMIDRIWAGRMRMCDLMIDLRPDSPLRFDVACAANRLTGALRARVKTVYRRLTGRRR